MSMKMEELLQLIDAVSESDLTELEYKDENAEISLKKKLQPIQSGSADRRGVMYGRNCAAESRIK